MHLLDIYYAGEVSGAGTRVPYSKLSSLGITLTGLPESVSALKHPSAYGRRQLQAIVDNKQRLKFNGEYTLRICIATQVRMHL